MLIATTASEILKEIAEYLKLSSIWSDSWRFIGWQIIKLFMFISQQLSKSLTEIYKIFDIIDSPEILKIMNGLVPVAWAIGSVALGIYGIKYMGNPNMKLKKGIKNMVLGVAVISLSSVFLTQIVNVTKNLATTINAETSDLVSYSILNSNMYDLYKLEENNYDIDSDFHTNINNDNINFIDINETVDEMKLKRPLTGENIFGKKLIVDRNGKVYISSLDKHWMFLVKERYYRYNWHPFQIMAGLGILIAVYFFTSIKTVKLIFEMIYSLTMLKVTAFTDFENAQIVKKIIKNIWNVLLTLILITFLLYVYGIVYT
ncbi:pLS20_p028 family conjugation system transmembrane protein, partial [Granulicatella balaenopterae]